MKYRIRYPIQDYKYVTKKLDWKDCLEIIRTHDSMYVELRIPVTEKDFGITLNNKKTQEIIDAGFLDVYTSNAIIHYNAITLFYTIEEGDCGDEDGYGRTSNKMLRSFMDLQGTLLTPLSITCSPINYTIDTWINEQKNPFTETGNVIPHPNIDIHNDFNVEEFFKNYV